jgi:hypothetical protein
MFWAFVIFVILFVVLVVGFVIWLWIETNGGTSTYALENPLPHAFKNNPAGMVWLVTLVAFCTAAVVQLLKELLPIRYNYHRATVREWIASRARYVDNGGRAIHDLESLAAGVNERREANSNKPEFYHLPTEQMMGQISSAAEMAVSEPGSHLDLFLALASPLASQTENRELNYSELPPAIQYLLLSRVATFEQRFPNAVQTKPKNEGVPGDEIRELEQLFDRLREMVDTGADTERLEQLYKEVLQGREDRYEEQTERGRLRTDLMVGVHRALDGLQIELLRGWRRRLVGLCCFTSAIVSLIAVPLISSFQSSGEPEGGITFKTILFAIGFCWLSGTLFAPFAHDVMTTVRRFRR